MARPPRKAGSPKPAVTGSQLQAKLRELLTNGPADRALPTTRQLGEEFGLANTTVYRALRALTDAGEIWQHPTSGRYYPAAASALLDRPKPIACLIRRLELASELYRELLEGISKGCGEQRRTMLLWHDELLLNHPDPNAPPVFASGQQQRSIIAGFLDRHGESAGGFIVDHLWSDETLRYHTSRLTPAVVLFRRCDVEGYSNIRANFHAGALKAIGHLLGRGYEQIIPVEPFVGDPAVEQFLAAFAEAANELGCQRRIGPPAVASTAKEQRALIERTRNSKRRTALLCPEDNVALLLHTAAREAGLRVPDELGLLSAMGTDFATKAGISSICYDYPLMGRMAVYAIEQGSAGTQVVEPQLFAGSTT